MANPRHTADSLLLRGKVVLTDARLKSAGLIRDGGVLIEGDRVAATGAFVDLARLHPQARVIGDGSQLVLPGLADAHCHGRGLSPIQKGVPTDFLENALFDWAVMPILPPELAAALCALRHIRSGCTLLHHNGFDDDGPAAGRRAECAIRTYLSTGIRLAFSPAIRDESRLALDEEGFLATLPPDLQAWAAPLVRYDKRQAVEDYFALFDDLFARHNGPDTRVLLAPSWAHGATDGFLRRVRDRSDALGGVPIHMHLLQTPVQKAYGLRRRGISTLEWLDGLGLVDRQVVYGHAIHVTARDIELLGRRRAGVTNHPSCNLHMRNGIAPVVPMRAAGVTVAMGMDDKTINDDEDAVMEVRMLHKLHRLHTFELTAPALDAYEALEMATINGARVCGFEGETGALVPGLKADAILVDLGRVERDPWIHPGLDPIEGFVQRALGEDVRTVLIGGRIVMEDRRVLSIDAEALSREVREVCGRPLPPEQAARAAMLRRIKPYVQAWYRTWHEGMVASPFYAVNSRE
ncbi:MAG: amidohydrolase family protein [Candidatus Methylomirabilota bacterium]